MKWLCVCVCVCVCATSVSAEITTVLIKLHVMFTAKINSGMAVKLATTNLSI